MVDSAPDLAHSLGIALGTAGLPPPSLADATGWIGDGVRVLVQRGLHAGLGRPPNDAQLDAVLKAFMDDYRDRLFVDSSLYPGVETVLRQLRAAKIVVGCVTNKAEGLAHVLFQQAGIDSLLDFVYGGDTFPAKKPDPEALNQAAARFGVSADRAVMVGDSVNDLKAAQNAGFRFVFARYGYARTGRSALEQYDMTIASFRELGPLLCGA